MSDNYKKNQDMCMDWDDEIQSDGAEFIILPEGDYNFTVIDFERGRFPGGPKLPPCNKATLTLQVKTDDGIATARTDLILYRTLEWRISAFFRCIGQKKHGERLVMNWNKVVGSKGRAHFKPRTYQDKDGNDRQANDVARFYDYDEKNFPAEDEWMELPEGTEELPFE
ncbi:MAG: hypothetical protein LUC32_07800 [Clostridiales bacterium]|nr:hypothetical protein [Clostridiales bacterium]